MRRISKVALAGAFLALLLPLASVQSQAVQAVSNASTDATPAQVRAAEREEIREQLEVLHSIATLPRSRGADPLLDSLRDAAEISMLRATALLHFWNDDSRRPIFRINYDDALRDFGSHAERYSKASDSTVRLSTRELALIQQGITFSTAQQPRATSILPALFKAGPAVNFTLGYQYASAARNRGGALQAVELGTNLVGAAAGAVFEALGEGDLSKYLKANLAIGTGLPLNTSGSRGELYSVAAIGLGEVRTQFVYIWPTLAVTQMDTSDQRIPASVRAFDAERASWSAPSLTMGVILTKWLNCFQKNQCYPPVFTVGMTAPHFYPGNPAQALGALFTGDRGKYRRAEGWELSLGVAVPLRALTKADP